MQCIGINFGGCSLFGCCMVGSSVVGCDIGEYNVVGYSDVVMSVCWRAVWAEEGCAV